MKGSSRGSVPQVTLLNPESVGTDVDVVVTYRDMEKTPGVSVEAPAEGERGVGRGSYPGSEMGTGRGSSRPGSTRPTGREKGGGRTA